VTENPFASDLGSMSAEAATDFFANLGTQQAKAPVLAKPEVRENTRE
jgi:protein transport protein SEC31